MTGLVELAALLEPRSTAVLLVGGAAAGLTVVSWIISDAINRPEFRSDKDSWPRDGHGYGDDFDERRGGHGHGDDDDHHYKVPKDDGQPQSPSTNITININLDALRDTLDRIERHVSPTRRKRLLDLAKNTFFAIFGSVVSIFIAAMTG
jgi:hypothetical protein